MRKESTKLPGITLVGIKERTNNTNETDPEKGKIPPTCMKYFNNGCPDKTQNRTKPGVTYCVYTEFESDHNGDYSYFIGEEVSPGTEAPEGMESITIEPQTYTKFTNGPQKAPEVIMEAWYKIWDMNDEDFGGKRRFHADFEIYDERAKDPNNMVVDFYIGIEP